MIVTLLAYSAIDGIPTMTDSEVRGLYERMEADDTAETVFYDGSVLNADDFLKTMKHGMTQLFMVSVDREVAGAVWLTDFEVRRASFHFCFFSNVWEMDLVDIGKECVCQILNSERLSVPMFDCLTGIVPVTNKRAIGWCEKMCFSVLGTLPNGAWIRREQRSVPATVYYVERGNYGKGI
jgi:hypothetical protein